MIPLHLISDPSGWRTALGSNTNDAPLIVRSLEQNSTPQSIPLHHGQFKLFFQHRVIPVKHAFLKQELLSSRLWTLGGALLSNGKDDDDKGELLPRFVSHIIVAKDIQISFTNNDLWDIIADLVVKHPSIDIAGLKITPEFSYVTPNTIIVSRPMIIGVVIKELPPTPNPDPALIK